MPYDKLAAGLSISKANDILSRGPYVEALDIYTHVLCDEALGHPVAFLNRSVCYLCSNTRPWQASMHVG
jgi:hypothetical protein